MSTPQTPAPATGPIATITNVGTSLIRLGGTVITLPFSAASSITNSLVGIVSNVGTSLNNAVAPQASNEIVKAASDLIGATTGLYVGVLKATAGGLDTVVRTINTAVSDVTAPASK
ncbi:MAG: hypothetical protein WCI67_00390 [Chloroflexales bacterium]